MNCPICNSGTKVVETRLSSEGTGIRRRRECTSCEYRFTTVEEIDILDLTIVKQDGKRESYDRSKIERGIIRALHKRAYTHAGLKQLMYKIERDIQRRKASELTSDEIGDIVMRHLKAFDGIAYIRFASVYRQFEDVQTFKRELEELAAMRNQEGI